ncbi:filaggrin-2-like [Hetaerina americana]|uniref:filaggrin-2-like n=1 Tax=Hetaerina americana TaxID=62018 RepID=UPI003A7F4EDF
MAARSLFMSALALVCAAALVQCVMKPVEKQEFNVYSGLYSSPNAPCKAHYYNVEEPPQKEEDPCMAHGYGLVVPQPRREVIQCSSHGYKVEVPQEEEEQRRNAYGYLVSQPRPDPEPRCLSVGYQVEAPSDPVPERSNAYGYAVAVPKKKFRPCVAQSFNYQVEAPPPPEKEEKYAYGIAVQTFPKPPPSIPCVDDYEIPESDPRPPQKPCLPCEDDYVFPKPQYSFSIREKSHSSSECPCNEDDGGDSSYSYGSKQYHSGGDYESRYEQNVQDSYGVTNLRDSGEDSSYEDESPLPGGYARKESYGESAEVGYGGDSNAWGTSSAEDLVGDRQDDEGYAGEGDSYDSAVTSQEGDSQTEYGGNSQDTTSFYAQSPYHAFFSRVAGWDESSTSAEDEGCGCRSKKSYGDSNHGGYSPGNSQSSLSLTSYFDDSKNKGSRYESNTVQSSLSTKSYEDEMCSHGRSGSYGFKDGNFNTPVQFSVGAYEDASGKEDSAVNYGGYSGISSYNTYDQTSGDDQEKYVDSGSYEQGQEVLVPYSGTYAEDQNSSADESSEYEKTGDYESKTVDSNNYEGINTYSISNDPTSKIYKGFQDSGYDGITTYSVPSYSASQKYEGYQDSDSEGVDAYSVSIDPASQKYEEYEDSGHDGITTYSIPSYSASQKYEGHQDSNDYEKGGSSLVAYGEMKPYATAQMQESYSDDIYGDSISYGQDRGENDVYSNVQSYPRVEKPSTGYYYETSDDLGSSENKGVESVEFSKIPSNYHDYNPTSYVLQDSRDSQNQNRLDEISYGSKASYSTIKCPCSASHKKYDGGLSFHSVGSSVSYDSGEDYTQPKYYSSHIGQPSHVTSGDDSYIPFPFSTHHLKKEYHGVVGHNLYEEVQANGHFRGTLEHRGNNYPTSEYSFAHDGEYVTLGDAAKEDDTGYYGKKSFYDISADEGTNKEACSTDQSHKVLKKVVVVHEKPYTDYDGKVTIEKVKKIKYNSKEIIDDDLTEYVPEKETKVIVTEVISSGENIGRKISGEYVEEPVETRKIIVEKITSSSESDTEGHAEEKEIELRKYVEEESESDSKDGDDEESVRPTNENVESYEVVKKVVNEDGDIVEKEEIAGVKTYGEDADRVVVVEEDEKSEGEVIVEREPEVVYEKEVLVKEDDGYGGEKVVSKEVITKIRPAVAVEVSVSEPHHQQSEKVFSYKKSHSSEYKPRGSHESSYVVSSGKSSSYESPIVEKVVIAPSKHSSKEVTEVIEEYAISGEGKGSHQEKTITKIYSGERHGGDDVSRVRTAELEKILTEDPEEEKEYTRPSYVSGEKHKTIVKVHRGSSGEYANRGSGSKEKVVIEKEYVEPEEKTYAVSYETKASQYYPGAKKTVIVTKKTSSEVFTPKLEPELENTDVENAGSIVSVYKKIEDPDKYDKVTKYETSEYRHNSGNDEKYHSKSVHVGSKYSKEEPIVHSHSHGPHKTVIVTKSSTEYKHPKHETIVTADGEYEDDTVYVGKKHPHSSEPIKKVLITKKVSTEYEEPTYEEENIRRGEDTRKVYYENKYHGEHPERDSYTHTPSVVLTKKVTTEYEREPQKYADKYDTLKKHVKIITDEPERTYSSYSNSHERVSAKDASTAYTKVTKSYEDEPEVTKKVFVTKKVSYAEDKPRVQYSSYGDDGSNVDVSYKSHGSKTSEYSSPIHHHHEIKHKYKTNDEGTVSYRSRPSYSSDAYSKSSIESAPSPYPKYEHAGHGKEYSPKQFSYDGSEAYEGGEYQKSNVDTGRYYKDSYSTGSTSSRHHAYDNPTQVTKLGGKAYSSASELRGDDNHEPGYISVPQGTGYWHSRVHSRAEAVNSHNSAYQAVQVKGGGGMKYYGGEGDGVGRQYQSYSSGSNNDAEGQAYGDYYQPMSSRGSRSNSYAMEGGADSEGAVGEQSSLKGYGGGGGIKSFVIRQAHGNTKKSSGYRHFEHHVSSGTGGGSDTYNQRWSTGS